MTKKMKFNYFTGIFFINENIFKMKKIEDWKRPLKKIGDNSVREHAAALSNFKLNRHICT